MTITKEQINGKTVYNVFVKVRDNTGKQVSMRRRGILSEREAKKVEFDLRVKLEGFKDKVTWQHWVDHCLERVRVEYRYSTYLNYKFNLEKWANPIWKDRFIDDIAPSDIHKFVFERVTGVSSYTKRGIIKIVKRVFNMAIEEGLLIKNPAVGVRVKTADANQLVLNKNEIQILLKEAKSIQHRFYHHWAFAILTGMRSGEMHCLKWTDVDLVSGFFTISKAWTRHNGEGPTKTAKNRVCPISKECRKLLLQLKSVTGSTPFVLPRLWEWDQGLQAQILKNFCTSIGVTPVRFHDLRATFITQMLNNGVPLSKVMAIVGHSSLKTTQGYLRLSGKDIEGATDDLAVTLPEEVENDGNVLHFKK